MCLCARVCARLCVFVGVLCFVLILIYPLLDLDDISLQSRGKGRKVVDLYYNSQLRMELLMISFLQIFLWLPLMNCYES